MRKHYDTDEHYGKIMEAWYKAFRKFRNIPIELRHELMQRVHIDSVDMMLNRGTKSINLFRLMRQKYDDMLSFALADIENAIDEMTADEFQEAKGRLRSLYIRMALADKRLARRFKLLRPRGLDASHAGAWMEYGLVIAMDGTIWIDAERAEILGPEDTEERCCIDCKFRKIVDYETMVYCRRYQSLKRYSDEGCFAFRSRRSHVVVPITHHYFFRVDGDVYRVVDDAML